MESYENEIYFDEPDYMILDHLGFSPRHQGIRVYRNNDRSNRDVHNNIEDHIYYNDRSRWNYNPHLNSRLRRRTPQVNLHSEGGYHEENRSFSMMPPEDYFQDWPQNRRVYKPEEISPPGASILSESQSSFPPTPLQSRATDLHLADVPSRGSGSRRHGQEQRTRRPTTATGHPAEGSDFERGGSTLGYSGNLSNSPLPPPPLIPCWPPPRNFCTYPPATSRPVTSLFHTTLYTAMLITDGWCNRI